MAAHCKMSVGKVVDAKKELQQAGLIHITPGDPKASTSDRIRIINVWAENLCHYQTYTTTTTTSCSNGSPDGLMSHRPSIQLLRLESGWTGGRR